MDEVRKILDASRAIGGVDSSELRSMVQYYLNQVKRFLDLNSFFSSRLLEKDKIEMLKGFETFLTNLVVFENNLQSKLVKLKE